MKIQTYIDSLVEYSIKNNLAEDCDKMVLRNRLLGMLNLADYVPSDEPLLQDLEQILAGFIDYAVANNLCEDNSVAKDLFDTKIMGAVTPMPREVRKTFQEKFNANTQEATDWYYKFSCDTDYIRRYRIKKDMRWKVPSDYGQIDITINLSKPEKDPKAIAAAKNAVQSGYPKCQLCVENEGYYGRLNHPARENHRIIPITVAGKQWYFQYSPYVYYNEHCIVFNGEHTPMKIDRSAFDKLLSFVGTFPHYFVGSNADLPIVGGSILSHEHFQGGHYTFAMETSPIEKEISFEGYSDIKCGIVKWPMSIIRLTAKDPNRISELAEKILNCWRKYSDVELGIIAESNGEPPNTITPIARRRGSDFELDLVLRCNITTEENPLGVFHPHADKHHIKKENIGLIEVMGLAVLPSRLKKELYDLATELKNGNKIDANESLNKHADWVKELESKYDFKNMSEEEILEVLKTETGVVFTKVLEDAGVYKCDAKGREGFVRFVDSVNK